MHSENEVVYLYLDDIIPNRFQPREVFDERALKELAVSIKEHGVIQPIIVRKIGEKYEIIAGERRYKASALAGLTKIPAIVRNLDDKESSKIALLENLQRKNLNPIEEAKTYQKILELDQMTQAELAKTMGKSQAAVANKLRLLTLSEDVQNALLKEKISERHARTLLSVGDLEKQKALLDRIVAEKITVRELERIIKVENSPEGEIDTGEEGSPKTFERPTETDFEEPQTDLNRIKEETEKSKVIDQPIPISGFEIYGKKPTTEETNIDRHNSDIENQYIKRQKSDEFEEKHKPKLMDNIDGIEDYNNEEALKPEFINYGEIDSDEESEKRREKETNFKFTSTPNKSQPSNYDEERETFLPTNKDLKESSKVNNEEDYRVNLKELQQSSHMDDGVDSADLDSLLNLNPKSNNDKKTSFDTFKPAAEAFDEDSINVPKEYFTSPDVSSIDLPKENARAPREKDKTNQRFNNSYYVNDASFSDLDFKEPTIEEYEEKNNVAQFKNENMHKSTYGGALKRESEPIEDIEPETITLQRGINTIRRTLDELEKKNLKLDIDEMNFENSYQIIIKIEKPKS